MPNKTISVLSIDVLISKIKTRDLNFNDCEFSDFLLDSNNKKGRIYLDDDKFDFCKLLSEFYPNDDYKLSFCECTFKIPIIFSNIRLVSGKNSYFLKNVRFEQAVYFEHIHSNTDLVLSKSSFESVSEFIDFNLSSSLILGSINFKSNVFFTRIDVESFIMTNSVADGIVEFTGIRTKKHFELTSEFKLDLIIKSDGKKFKSKCLGYSDFSSQMNNIVIFDDVIFDFGDFRGSMFGQNQIIFNECKFVTIGLFRNLSLGKNVIFKQCNLTNCSFVNSIFEDALFIGCKFDYHFLIDERKIRKPNNEKKNITSDEFLENLPYQIHLLEPLDVTPHEIMNTYRMFETNFDKHKDYESSGEFHKKIHDIGFLINTNELINLGKRIINCIRHPLKVDSSFIFLFSIYEVILTGIKIGIRGLYKISSNYGESYVLTLSNFLIILFIYSFLYLNSGIIYHDIQHNRIVEINYSSGSDTTKFNFWNDFGVSLSFSLNNSIPIKRNFENVKSATEKTNIISYFQTIIQTILITLFIISIRRKFKR